MIVNSEEDTQYKRGTKMVSLLDLKREYHRFSSEIDSAIRQVTKKGNYIIGPEVNLLEQQVAEYLGMRHCIGVASGTDALLISLRALAIARKNQEYFSTQDEIITTPFTFTATGGAILRAGATPVFVDIDPVTYNIDPAEIVKAIGPNTIGILPVHLYGQPCDMDKITKIAKDHSLFVLEDVAQAFGGSWQGQKLGCFGDIAAYSFFPSKNLGCYGDGGMIATDDSELANLVKMLRTHGGKDKYDVKYIGYNSRLDTLQAAILLVKLKNLERMNKSRNQIALAYNESFKNLNWLTVPQTVDKGGHVYHQYTVRITEDRRNIVQNKLKEKGISSAVYYPVPLHQMNVFYEKCKIVGPLVNAENACSEVLSLPIDPLLEDNELNHVIKNIKTMKFSGII